VLLPDYGTTGYEYENAPQFSFSGGVYYKSDSEIVALFTEIGRGQSYRTAPVQRIARASDNSISRFEVSDVNLLEHADLSKPDIPGQRCDNIKKIYEERDPCIFEEMGQTFMILGGTLNKHRKSNGVVTLYRAIDDTWKRWEYMGIFYESVEHGLIECPKFFRIGDKWILIMSPGGQTVYVAGEFDGHTGVFTPNPEEAGLVDQMPASHAKNFYAPYVETTSSGRVLLAGWVTQGRTDESWNGAIVLRELSWEGGQLRHAPLEELRNLRSFHEDYESLRIDNEMVLPIEGQALELLATLPRGKKVALRVHGVDVVIDGKQVRVGDQEANLGKKDGALLQLHIFIDGRLMQLFADGLAYTLMVEPDSEDKSVRLLGGMEIQKLDIWKLDSTWDGESKQLEGW
jgi:beta-fructofuranosidase